MFKKLIPAALTALALTSAPAFAHVGIGDVSHFSSGFFHPIGGLDHVLAMVAVGLYAAQLGGRNIWLIPLAFIGTMIAGGLLGFNQISLPMVEQGIGLSVIVMGVVIALGVKLPTAAAMALVALFALFHGHAHGSEGAGAGEAFLPYAAGFILATSTLHMAGIAVGLGLKQFGDRTSLAIERVAGTAGALAGISLLTGWLAA